MWFGRWRCLKLADGGDKDSRRHRRQWAFRLASSTLPHLEAKSRRLATEPLEVRFLLSLSDAFSTVPTLSPPVDPRWFAAIDFAALSGEIASGSVSAAVAHYEVVPGGEGAWSPQEPAKSGPAPGAVAGLAEPLGVDGFPSNVDIKSSRQWIITLQPEVSSQLSTLTEVCQLFGFGGPEVTRVVGLGQKGVLLVEWCSAEIAVAQLAVLTSHPFVAAVEPNGAVTVTALPNDPLFTDQWAWHNPGGAQGLADADIDAPEAWDFVHDASSVVVAVVDSGIDYRHPDLAANMWINPREIPGNGRDDDGNGFVDDVYGYDFAAGDGDPFDEHGHGTHVAGIIGAVGNNGRGIAGVAWRVGLMAVRFLGRDGSGSIADAVRAINYVTMMRSNFGVNVRAINASWGTEGFSQALETAIRTAGQAGIIFVAAAGNDSRNNDRHPHYPSNHASENVIAVAASDRQDRLAAFSNFGPEKVHLAAPGVDILSTYLGERYAWMSGTSMSTAFVTGTVALVAASAPSATLQEVRQAIIDGVDRLPGWSPLVASGGRLNARGALERLNFRVVNTWPATYQAVSEPPTVYRLWFSAPVDPRTASASGFLVNGQAADEVRVTGATQVEFRFTRSPVAQEGPQRVELSAGAVRQMGTARAVSPWEGIFYYDRLPGRIVSADPPPGAVVSAPPREFVLSWNEPLDPASVRAADLLLSDGFVVAAALRNANTVVYQLAELPADGTVEFVLPAGSLRDVYGNPQPGFAGSWTIRDPQLVRLSASDVPQAITDLRWTRSVLTVNEPLVIADLDLFVTIEHTYAADLDVYLVGPDGTRIVLWEDVGGSGENFVNTVLDDEAPQAITEGRAPFRGRYRPMQPLGVFRGRSAQGQWTLEVYDDSLFDQGQLVSWGLLIRQSGRVPPYVTAVWPSPEVGGEILEATSAFEVTFSQPVFVHIEGLPQLVKLSRPGRDGSWGTADDEVFTLSVTVPNLPTTCLVVTPHAGRLPPGEYRLRMAAEGFRNADGTILDGDGDGAPGGDFVLPFRVLPAIFYGPNRLGLPIRDLQWTISELDVPDDFTVSDVDVLVDIEHPFTADLDIYLISPDGTWVELASDVGGAGRNFRRTIFDDEAATPISQARAPFSGRYRPEDSLAALRGKRAQGTWQLQIYDDSRRDEGTLHAWGLILSGMPLEPPRVTEAVPLVDETGRLVGMQFVFSRPMTADSFQPTDDVVGFRGPAGPVPVIGHRWLNERVLQLAIAPQSVRGEYRLELSPWIADRWGFHLDNDGDGIPGEVADDTLWLRIPLPVALGIVGHGVWTLPMAPDGILWVAVENARAGLLTFVAEGDGGAPLELQLMAEPLGPPVAFASGRGKVRLDVLAPAAGRLWYLRIAGPVHQVKLQVVNALEQAGGGVLNVYGTDDRDSVSLVVGEETLALTWNGLFYGLQRDVFARVNLFGGGGDDQLAIRWLSPLVVFVDPLSGAAQLSEAGAASFSGNASANRQSGSRPQLSISWNEWERLLLEAIASSATAMLYPAAGAFASVTPGALVVSAPGWSVDLRGLQMLTIIGGGTDARVTLRGGPADDVLVARPHVVSFRSGMFTAEVRGVGTVDAFAGSGGVDTASVWGSGGDDVLTIGASTSFAGPNFSLRVSGFGVASYYPGPGGRDVARIYDSPADDIFTITPSYVSFSARGTVHRVFGFPAVVIYAGSGGVDVARLYDSPGDDQLWCSPEYFRWSGPGFDVQGRNFRQVIASSTGGGKDRATLVGSPGAESFRYQAGVFRMSSGSFQVQVARFAQVSAHGRGGADRATLYDSPGDDLLTATPAYTTLTGPGYELRVYDVAEIQALSTAGGKDTARLYPQAEEVSVTLTAQYGVLQGPTFFSRAWGFPVVIAYAAPDRRSTAKLYGTVEPERLQYENNTLGLLGQTWRRYAVGFSDLFVYMEGGSNRAEVVLDVSPARLTVEGMQLRVVSSTTRLAVWGCELLEVRGRPGSDHRAVVAGTTGRDLLEAYGNLVRLTGLEQPYRVELFDFSFVEARSTGGTDERLIAEGVDYVLTTGSWIER